jgi:DNA primase
MIDFKRLNESLPGLQVLELLMLRRAYVSGAYWRGKCPFHQSSSAVSRSFEVNLDRRVYYCFRCKATGDLLGLWARLRGVRNYLAAEQLAREFGHRPERE